MPKQKVKIHNLALSVRQPFAEQIMRGTKKIEYRTISTNIRGRVYIYAGKQPRLDAYEKMGVEAGAFPAGVIVGTVEIIDCIEKNGEYQWLLAKPQRLRKMLTPDNRAHPVWFKPFK